MCILPLLLFISTNAFPLDLAALTEKLPHITLPFSLAEKGYVLTTDFKAGGNRNKAYIYTFYLSFLITDDDLKSGHIPRLLGFGTQNDGGAYTDADGSIRSGVLIPLKLRISRLEGKNEVTVLTKEYKKLSSSGAGNSRLFTAIDHIKLEPANYKVRLETLAAVPELAGVPVNFEIGLPGKH